MSQGSSQESLMLSQETFQSLQAFLEEGVCPAPVFQYPVAPYNVELADNSAQENLQINIQRYSVRTDIQDFMPNSMEPHSPHVAPAPPMSSGVTTPMSPMYSMPSPCNGLQSVCKPEPPYIGRHEAITPPPDHQPPLHNLVPSNTDFPGFFNFDVGFEKETAPPTKSARWTYSTQLKKLFIKMRCLVPIRLFIRGSAPPPPGSYIQVLVVHKSPDNYKEVVERCLNHITKQKDGHHAPKHLLRCENPNTMYETSLQTGWHTIKVPIRSNEAGMDYYTELFQFMCFNSCPGALNRRPIIAIFTLENGGRVIGRKVLNVRVCACPGRDRGDQEAGETKKKGNPSGSSEPTPPPTPLQAPVSPPEEPSASPEPDIPQKTSGKRDASMCEEGFTLENISSKKIKRETDDDNEMFTIQVRGRQKYELLLKIKESLDIMDMLPQSFIDKYRASCPANGPNWFLEQQRRQQQQTSDSQNSNSSTDSEAENSPPSTFPLSQLSRTSSNASHASQGSSGGSTEISAVRFSLKRTVSLDRKGLLKHC